MIILNSNLNLLIKIFIKMAKEEYKYFFTDYYLYLKIKDC